MPYLTTKMVTAKNDIGNACKVWFPFNEGLGNTHTDLQSNIAFTTAGSTYNTPHTAAIVETAADSGSLVVPAGATILLLAGWVPTFATFNSFGLGKNSAGISRIGFDSGLTATIVDDDDTSVQDSSFVTPVASQDCFAGLLLDGATGDLTTFDSINGAAITANTLVSGSPLSTITIDLTEANGMPINNTIAQPTYASALWVTSDSVTEANCLEWFEWMRQKWSRGEKVHHPDMKTLLV